MGASRTAILRMMLGDVGWMIVFGVGVGCIVAWLARQGVGGLLYGLGPGDLSTLGLAAALLSAAGLAAGLLPARRAASIDPVQALRE